MNKRVIEDADLIDRLKQRDDSSFKIIIDKYQKHVLNSCYRFVCNRQTAEDLTQDVFLEVYRSIDTFRMDCKLSTWIYRIAVTKSLDYLKNKKRKKRFGLFENFFDNGKSGNLIPAMELHNPDTNLIDEERIKVISEALEHLPRNQRIAFTLSKYDGMSYKEIADILSMTTSAVESLIHRAKVNLKKKLYNYYKGK